MCDIAYMDIEVVLVLQVVRSKFSKAVYRFYDQPKALRAIDSAGNLLGLVPSNNVGDSNFVEASEEGEGSEDEGRNHPLPLIEDLEDGSLLGTTVSARCAKHRDRDERSLRTCLGAWFFLLSTTG